MFPLFDLITDRLIKHWLADWLINWLIDWLIGWALYSQVFSGICNRWASLLQWQLVPRMICQQHVRLSSTVSSRWVVNVICSRTLFTLSAGANREAMTGGGVAVVMLMDTAGFTWLCWRTPWWCHYSTFCYSVTASSSAERPSLPHCVTPSATCRPRETP